MVPYPFWDMEKRKKPKTLRSSRHKSIIAVLVASRREAGLTQDQLAKRLGWHRSTIAKIENGERRMDLEEFIAIAEALGVPPEVLFNRVLTWNPKEPSKAGVR